MLNTRSATRGEPEAETFGLPEEMRLLQDTVRRFMRTDVAAAEAGLPHDAFKLPPEKLAPLQDKARALGLWCVESPQAYGGAGLSLLGQSIVAEEAAKCRMGAYIPACGAFGFDPPSVIFKGTPDQIARYAVPAIERGEKTFFAISEPGGGSDPGRAIKTRAERRGDRYLLNGTKFWITGASGSAWGIVFARTGPSQGRDGVSCFIVELDRPGVRVREIPVIRSYSPYELHFDNYEVPAENRLGQEGEGFRLVDQLLVHARVPYAAGTIGIAAAALDIAIDWAKQRETFGAKLADRQAVQWMIVDSEIELRAARLLVYDASRKADTGGDIKIEASIAKVYATEAAGRVIDRCIQILGGMGLAKEMPLERWYRELRIKRIGEGPSEVQRMVVARHLLGRRSGESVMAIDFELSDGIAVITINRPERLNAMDAEHYAALSTAWQRVRDEAAIRVAIITGAGDRAFTAGADLKSFITAPAPLPDVWRTQRDQLLNRGLEVWKPVIAAVNGLCVGGGMTLLMATDIRVAVEGARFGLSEVKRGIIAANGGTQRVLSQLPYAIAMEMLLTGEPIDAEQALRWGLINKVVPQAELMTTTLDYARRIAELAPLAVQAAKELAVRSRDMDLATGLRMEQLVLRLLQTSDDAKEGPAAFAEKRPPKFSGK